MKQLGKKSLNHLSAVQIRINLANKRRTAWKKKEPQPNLRSDSIELTEGDRLPERVVFIVYRTKQRRKQRGELEWKIHHLMQRVSLSRDIFCGAEVES